MSKTFSVAILTPSTGLCRMAYAQSLARLVMYFAQYRVFENVAHQNLCPDAIEGSGIAENYERMIDKYLADRKIRWTHFLSIEDDMGFAPDCLHILASRKLDIVGANYSTNKGHPQRFTAAGLSQRVLTTEDSVGVEQVSLLPQGFTLVSRRVYETLSKPWFLMGYSQKSGNYVYQDYYFSEQAKKHCFQLYVDHDVSKRLYHVGPKNYTWEDALRDELTIREVKGDDNGDITRSFQLTRDERRIEKQMRGSGGEGGNGRAQRGSRHRKPRQPARVGQGRAR